MLSRNFLLLNFTLRSIKFDKDFEKSQNEFVSKTHHSKYSSFHLQILVLVLFLAGFIGFYYSNQKKNSPAPVQTATGTTNWKTYTNSKYNYSFRYPDALMPLTVTGAPAPSDGNSVLADDPSGNPTLPDFYVNVITKSKKGSYIELDYDLETTHNIVDHLNVKVGEKFPESRWESTYTRMIDQKLLGLTARTFKPSNKSVPYYIVLEKDGYYYLLGTYDEQNKLFKKILSTFKFTK